MIRTLLYRLSFLLVLYLIVYVSMDPLLRWVAVKAGESAFGAKVEIGRLTTGLFPPRLELKRVAVADPGRPMKNLVEFERAAFEMEGRPLLEKKFIVREAAVTGLTFQTDRKVSGALPVPPLSLARPSPGSALIAKVKAQATQFSLGNIESAKKGATSKYEVKPQDLQALTLADQLKDRYTKSAEAWEARWKTGNFDARLEKVKRLFDEAQAESNTIAKVQKANAVIQEAKALSDGAKVFEKEFKGDLTRVEADLKAVQDAKKRDVDAILSRLNLPTLDAESLSRLLLGPAVSTKVATGLDWVARARDSMPASQPKPAPPRRGKGTTIPFPTDHTYPRWAVRTAQVSGLFPIGAGQALAFEGRASGITAEPALLGRPAELKAYGKIEAAATVGHPEVRLAALLDHRKEPATDAVEFTYQGLRMDAMQLGSPDSIEVNVTGGTATVQGRLTVTGDALDGTFAFTQRGMTLTPRLGSKGGGEIVQRVLTAALHNVDRLEARITVRGTLKDPDWSVQSSLGTVLSDGIRKAVGLEFESQRKAIEAKVQALVGERLGPISKALQGDQGKFLSRFGGLDKSLQAKIDKVQKSLLGPSKDFNLKDLFK